MASVDEVRSHAAFQEIPRVLQHIVKTLDRQQKVAEYAVLRECVGTHAKHNRLMALDAELWPTVDQAH